MILSKIDLIEMYAKAANEESSDYYHDLMVGLGDECIKEFAYLCTPSAALELIASYRKMFETLKAIELNGCSMDTLKCASCMACKCLKEIGDK